MKKLILAALALAVLTVVSCEDDEFGQGPVYKSIECKTANPKVGDTCILQLAVDAPGRKFFREELTWDGNGGVFVRPDLPKDLCEVKYIQVVGGKPTAQIKYVDPEKYVPYIKWVPTKAGIFEFTVKGTVTLSMANEGGYMMESIPQQGKPKIKGTVTVSAAD